jgi:hypothetical protein
VSDARRSQLLVVGAALASLALVIAYLAAGGADYSPAKVADPCEPREWRDPQGLEEIAEQFSLSALDGAACELQVSREQLARGLATEQSRETFVRRYGIDDATLEAAVRAGLVRAVDDAEDAGALPPLVALPLREVAERIPVDEAIQLIEDSRPLFQDAEGFLGGLGGFLGQAESLLPEDLQQLIP